MAKRPDYYANPREDLARFVPENARRILDIGCGIGRLGELIKARPGGAEVTGIELDEETALKARPRIDKVLTGDVEKVMLPVGDGYFDCIIYGDVLEHLMDPWALLKKQAGLLRKGGYVIASIPNAAHYRIRKMLARHEWNYEYAGIMDRSHIRFFTIKTIRKMFEEAGLHIKTVERNLAGSKVKKALNKIFFNCLADDLTEQYIIVAEK